MSLEYHVDIEDTSGSVIAVLKNPISFSCTIRIGEKGDHQLVISGFESVADNINEDYIIRFYRNDTEAILPNGNPRGFVNIFNGIHKTYNRSLTQSGQKTFTSYGPDSKELLDKAFILYAPNSSQSNKSLPASTAMIQFVLENIGSSALVANGRRTDHVNPIVVSGSSGLGATWSDEVANKNLLTVLQNIRDYTREQGLQIDFEVNYLGNYQWEFICGTNLYNDRTTIGLVPTTGKNGSGNVPIVFSPLYKNVKNFFESKSRYNEANTVTAIGSGVGALQQTATVKRIAAATISAIGQRETVVNSSGSSSTQLAIVADSALYELEAKTKVNFEPLLNSVKIWHDLFPGDYISVLTENRDEFHLQLTEVSIDVSQSEGGSTVERLNLNFELAVL